MRKSTLVFLAFVLAPSVAGSGCDTGDPIATTPSTPTQSVTETFSGSLTINGAVTFTLTTTGAGLVTVTLRSVGPDSSTQMGLGLGTWNGTSCNVQISDDRAIAGSSIVGQANAPGVLCARVADIGQLKGTVTFEITVVHP